jgi:IS1 family transposase
MNQRWLIYAYAPENKEVMGYVMGDRSAKTVKKLYKMLKKWRIDTTFVIISHINQR